MRSVWLLAVFSIVCWSISGCSDAAAPPMASIGTAPTVTKVVAGPVTEADLRTVISIIEGLPEGSRPSFAPALEPVELAHLRAIEMLPVIRRNYMAALEVGSQAEAWAENRRLVEACLVAGVDLDQLAVLMTRIGCAHHANESGSQLDIATARSDGEARIAEILPRIDSASDKLARQKLIDTLSALVAFDAYLTLLDLVPSQNRQIVSHFKPQLKNLLPATPDVKVLPQNGFKSDR